MISIQPEPAAGERFEAFLLSLVRPGVAWAGSFVWALIATSVFWTASHGRLQAESAWMQAAPQRIEAVRIVGNRRIPESTIRYYIQVRENDTYDESQILRDYRSLLNTNFFEDATVKKQEGELGVTIIFEVKERPLIRAIEYEGMKSFKESDVLEKFRDMRVGLTVDSPFDESRLPRARRAIKMLLDQNGRPLGRVEVEAEPITATSVKLLFRIDEGPKVRIGNISFEGNTVLSDGQLRDALELNKERGLFSIFKGHDKYIDEKLEFDIQVNLLSKYRELGYIYAKAGDPEVEIVEAPRGWLVGFRKTRQQYFISVPIEEGEQFYHGTFEIEGATQFPVEAIRRIYNAREGEVFNLKALQEANDNLKKFYGQFGFLDMDAIPSINPDQDSKRVDVTIQIEEGRQYIVNRIHFAGNTKTRDKVLRREFFLEEQQTFNSNLLDISILRLNQLGFFDRIEEKDYEVNKRAQDAEVEILVKVKERSQQSIGLTGGVSGIQGSFIGINYQSNNFRGLGQQIDVQLLTGTRTANYSFRFTEPYFRDSRLSLSMAVFNQRFRFDTFTAFFGLIAPSQNVQLFTRTSTGFDLGGTYPISRFGRAGLSYSLQNIKISDTAEVFEDFAFNQLIGFTPGGSLEEARRGLLRSEVTPSIFFNTKDAFFNATRGSNLILQFRIAGGPFGGTFNILRPFIEYQKFMPDRLLSGGRNTFALRIQLEHLRAFGRLHSGEPAAVPFFERIFSGGEFSFRGFDLRSVSPIAITRQPALDRGGNPIIDPSTGLPRISESVIPVGGDTSGILTGEYRIPIAGPLQVVGFTDFGMVTILRKSDLRLFGPSTFIELLEDTNRIWRMSTGAEVQFLLPVINQPFRLIFGYNPMILDTEFVLGGVRFEPRERRRSVRFTVGYSF